MQTITGYEITDILYDSTNSIVYRARRTADQQRVILKVLKEPNPTPERIAWFRQEYETTCSMAMDGVVQAYSLETHDHRWMMVMEDFGGDSLRRLNLIGSFNLEAFFKLAIEVIEILGHIHQQHIIHKDLNPANIILNPETHEIKLIDFGIATVLSRENPTFRNPRVLEGTLAYMSPEQAGRMNRTMDYRTDFYSLGVTFYELLTGHLPFESNDPLELIHSHIARQPLPPHRLRSDIPPTMSAIILKLMAKNAEDRYQSAYGLKADLEECLRQWQAHQWIQPFPPGRHDISDRFSIPQKLYGREKEIKMLMHTFGEVSEGESIMMLVAGYSGIGKSALVQEIYKPVTRHRGYFISGKFDQFQRNIPYSAFIQAFRSLILHLLTETEEEIQQWQATFLKALRKNGNVLIEVIPEVELIIGPQPEVVALGPAEAQNRLNMVFQNFIKIFARREHPLVIFLDDLQWADGASLKLMERLMIDSGSRYLFLIGAYRDNEVSPDHPFWLTLQAMRQAGATLHTMTLASLDAPAVTRLITDTLHCEREAAASLADLVIAKTGGNPFFLIEFLKSLYLEKLINFDHTSGSWEWNLEHINRQNLTDNVVELMAGRVQRLGEQTQHILQLAAGIGNQFNLVTLAMVSEQSVSQTARELMPAVKEGLIIPLGDSYRVMVLDVPGLTDNVTAEYKFAHDRIQQAVYSLISVEDRWALHWRIGKLLLQNIPTEEREDHIFDVVNQLNQGLPAANGNETDPSPAEIAHLNLIAGKKAHASAAYEPALNYLHTGVDLLAEDGWQHHYDLTLTLHQEYARCVYLNGHFDEAEGLFDLILEKATSTLDCADVYNTRMLLYTSMGKLQEVLETGLQGLKLLGMDIPMVPDQAMIDRELEQVRVNLGDHRIADLIYLPNATQPEQLAIMKLLVDMLITAWWRTNQQLLYLTTLKIVNLSLRYGNTDGSSFGYAWYGLMVGSGLGDYKAGYEFGQLALRLNEKFHNVHLVAKVNLVYAVFVHIWRYHVKTCLEFVKRGYQTGIESGDLVWAGINGYVIIYTLLIKGDDLDHVYQESQRYLDFARKTRQVIPINMITLSQQLILCLKGLTRAPGSFSDSNYNEEYHIKEIKESEAVRPIFWYYKIKLQALYLFEQYTDALKIAQELDRLMEHGAALGNVTMPEHYYYYSLTLAALYGTATEEEQETSWQILNRNQEKMKVWSSNCAENFLHKYLLIAAEMARIEEHESLVMPLYDRAIASAREHGYTQHHALASELAARYCLTQGHQNRAKGYLQQARSSYLQWGAMAKVKALDTGYAWLLHEESQTSENWRLLQKSTHGITITTSSGLDLSTLMKALQTISSEMVLDTLLSKLMRIVMENAGAERGVLLLEREGRWVIEAESFVEQDAVTVLQTVPIRAHEQLLLPESLINYVARTRESMVLHDAMHEGAFMHDRYIASHQPLSILCAPLLNQGKLTGMVYLENNLTTDAFTPERLEMINLLAAQAAISIENAKLYTTLERSEEKYRTLFETSRDTIVMTTLDGYVMDINPAGLELFGYTQQEMMSLNVATLYAEAQQRPMFQQTIAQQGSVKDYPVIFCRKDGTRIDCLMTSSVRRGDDGAILGYQSVIRDITEQKRAEAERLALLDQQARRAGELHAIIQSMADGLLVVDTHERIVIVNPVAATLLGRDSSELLDQPLETLSDVGDPVMSIGLQHIVEQVRHEMCDLDHALPEERISLGERIVRLQSAPTRGSGGLLTGAVVIIQDITQAVEADRAKSAFIATASHEMRTPLTSMKGYVDVFYMSGLDNLNENQRMFLDTIKRQTDNLVQLVNDLLEVARLEQGAMRTERRWVSLGSVLDELVSHMKTQIDTRQLYFHMDLPPSLPYLWIDPIHLRRILENILSNAVKYVPQGGQIGVRAYNLEDPTQLQGVLDDQPWKPQDHRSVVIEIADNGVGISEKDQEKIFNRFFRSENPLSVEAGGTGLGLAITRSLVNLHQGQIGFTSTEGEGSCFWVRFPTPSTEHVNGKETIGSPQVVSC